MLTAVLRARDAEPDRDGGTCPPPETQLDRFLFKVRVRYPAVEELTGSTSQFQQRLIFFSWIQSTPLIPTDIIGANIIVEEGMAKSALRKHFQF